MNAAPIDVARTLSLVVVRDVAHPDVLSDSFNSEKAVESEIFAGEAHVWFATSVDALEMAIEVVSAKSSSLSAGVATADTGSTERVESLVAQARSGAQMAEAGQVLVQLAAMELARYYLPDEITFSDIGSRSIAGGARCRYFLISTSSSVARTTPSGAANPWNPVRFVGRDEELAVLEERLRTVRFLSVVGPPGIGKTTLAGRLASHVEDEFDAGAAWVDLSEVSRPTLLLHKVAGALEVEFSAEPTLLRQIKKRVGESSLLVVLDGADGLEGTVADMSEELLSACPNVAILSTSLKRIASPSAYSFALEGLLYPNRFESYENVVASDAARLFVEVARVSEPSFAVEEEAAPDVATILTLVQGSPWAIQLIAKRADVLTVRQMLSRIRDDPFGFLIERDKPEESVRAALSSAVSVLNPWSQTLFQRLWVFRGAFNLDSLEAVCSDNALPHSALLSSLKDLVEAQLVHTSHRYRSQKGFYLAPIVREFSRERCGRAEAKGLQEKLEGHLNTKGAELWANGLGSSKTELEEFEMVYEDLRARWFARCKSKATASDVVSEIVRCVNFWLQRMYLGEGLEVVRAITAEPAASSAADYLSLLNITAWLEMSLGNSRSAATLAKTGVRLALEKDSRKDLGKLLNTLGAHYTNEGRNRSARKVYLVAAELAGQDGDPAGEAAVLSNLGGVLASLGDYPGAEAAFDRVAEVRGTSSTWVDVSVLANYAYLKAAKGDLEDAFKLLLRVVGISGEHPYPQMLPSIFLTACQGLLANSRYTDAAILLQAARDSIEHFGLSVSPARRKSMENLERSAGIANPASKRWNSERPLDILVQILDNR